MALLGERLRRRVWIASYIAPPKVPKRRAPMVSSSEGIAAFGDMFRSRGQDDLSTRIMVARK